VEISTINPIALNSLTLANEVVVHIKLA